MAALVAVLVAASEAALFADLAERRWLFGGLLAVMLGWMVGQVVAAVRVRIPVYELPQQAPATGPQTPAAPSPEAVRR